MSDAGLWLLGHKVYCQLREYLTQTWEMQMLINKNQVMLRLKVLILTLKVECPLRKRRALILGVQAFHAELQMSSEVAWNLEPCVEEMR